MKSSFASGAYERSPLRPTHRPHLPPHTRHKANAQPGRGSRGRQRHRFPPPAPRQNPLTSAAALATALFGADWRSRTHCSHRLCLVPPLIGCRVCGVYASASQRFYGLKRPCPPPPLFGAPEKAVKAQGVRTARANRLSLCLHPESGTPLAGPAQPLPPGTVRG